MCEYTYMWTYVYMYRYICIHKYIHVRLPVRRYMPRLTTAACARMHISTRCNSACDTTRSWVWHDEWVQSAAVTATTCVRIHTLTHCESVCDVTCSWVKHVSRIRNVAVDYSSVGTHTHSTRCDCVCSTTRLWLWQGLMSTKWCCWLSQRVHAYTLKQLWLCVWHNSFVGVTWLVRECDMTRECKMPQLTITVRARIHTRPSACGTTHS